MLASYCTGIAVACLAGLGCVLALVGAVRVLLHILRTRDYEALWKPLALLVSAVLLLAVGAQAAASRVWPPLRPRSIAVLVDQTYSMVDPDYGMPGDSIECAMQIVEQKVLPARLWWDREYLYPVTQNATTSFRSLQVDRSSGEPRLPRNPKPSPDERGSDYLKAVENLGGILEDDGGDRHLFVIGDLIHQSPGEPDPQRHDPPPPLARDRGRFRGVAIYLLYPDSRSRPYSSKILGFWRKYFADRGYEGNMVIETFPVALAKQPRLCCHPVVAGAVTLLVLALATMVAYRTRLRWMPRRGHSETDCTAPGNAF